ncbi:hypothetical protein ACIPYS_07360 [Kitasatospora sp. NPDC089913]|uniref:hypothetical protein n=1 Tax=Kitasatospora sp. NPDC089913 TaxID=3364080 RepID=UPI003815E5CD
MWRRPPPPARPAARLRRHRTLPWLVPAAAVVVLLAALPARCRATEPPLTPTGLTLTVTTVATSTTTNGPTNSPTNAPADSPHCDNSALFTASVTTDGRPGTLRYRWRRNDGTASDELRQPVRSGEYRTTLVLGWSFVGHGAVHATATVEILSPRSLSATASFDYDCPA